MSKMTSLGYAIDLAHRAGREGRDLSAAEVTKIIDEAIRLALFRMRRRNLPGSSRQDGSWAH